MTQIGPYAAAPHRHKCASACARSKSHARSMLLVSGYSTTCRTSPTTRSSPITTCDDFRLERLDSTGLGASASWRMDFPLGRSLGRRGDHRARPAAPDRARGARRSPRADPDARRVPAGRRSDHEMTRVEYEFETRPRQSGGPAEGVARHARLAAAQGPPRAAPHGAVPSKTEPLQPTRSDRRLDRLPRSMDRVRKLPWLPAALVAAALVDRFSRSPPAARRRRRSKAPRASSSRWATPTTRCSSPGC